MPSKRRMHVAAGASDPDHKTNTEFRHTNNEVLVAEASRKATRHKAALEQLLQADKYIIEQRLRELDAREA